MAVRKAVTDSSKKKMLAALEKTMGVVFTACQFSGVSRSQHYKWMGEDADYAEAVDDAANVAIDFAESKLHELIENGDTASTIFLLKTKGKNRGYTERQEIDHSHNGGIPTKIEFIFSDMSGTPKEEENDQD